MLDEIKLLRNQISSCQQVFIKHYGFVMYEFFSKLMCLSNPVEVTGNRIKTLAYYGMCPFIVHYESVMFMIQNPC